MGVLLSAIFGALPAEMSCLPARFGTQKLWITSFEERRIWAGTPTGR